MHLARVGFSKLHTDVGKLGEEMDSWGYGSTGRRSLNGRYESYGQSFGVGDEITCFLDLSSERGRISFAKNSMQLGPAYNITRPANPDGALFPHVLLKNVSVRVDFDGAVYGEQGVTGASIDGYLPWKVSWGDEKWAEPPPRGPSRAAQSSASSRVSSTQTAVALIGPEVQLTCD